MGSNFLLIKTKCVIKDVFEMTLFYDNMGIVREETDVKNSLYGTEISSSKLNDNSFFSVNVFFFPKYSFLEDKMSKKL